MEAKRDVRVCALEAIRVVVLVPLVNNNPPAILLQATRRTPLDDSSCCLTYSLGHS